MIDDGGVMSVDVRTSLRFVALASVLAGPVQALDVGFGEVDITPKLGGEEKVWLAGYGPGRQAAGVHDPLMARCVVLEEGRTRIALVSVDLVGLQFPAVQESADSSRNSLMCSFPQPTITRGPMWLECGGAISFPTE